MYIRYDNPATNPSQVYACTQTGASSFAWQFISHKVGTSAPAKCDVGEVFFNSMASSGSNWYGCTSADTWTLQGGGGGSGNPAGYTVTSFSSTPTFTAASNTSSSFLITLTGNVTSSTLAAPSTGQIITLNVCQDPTGGHTFVPPANMLGVGTVDPTANGCSHQPFYYDGTNANPVGAMFVTGVPGGAITLPGSTSGSLTLQPAAIAGTGSTLTLPGGTTDFSATGGTSQVVKQVTAGAALTVGKLSCSDVTDCWSPVISGSTTYQDLYSSCSISWPQVLLANDHFFWSRSSVGTPSYACGSAVSGETNGATLTTSATTSDSVQLLAVQSNYIAAANTVAWRFQQRFSLSSTSNIFFFVGMDDGSGGNNGVFVRYDTASDAAFKVCLSNASTPVCQTTTVAVDTNRHTVLFEKVSASQIRVTLDSTVYTFNTGAGTNTGVNLFSQTFTTSSTVSPEIIVQTHTTAARTATLVFTRFQY